MKLKFDVTADEFNIISNILASHLPKDCLVWVFGSRTKNKARFNSDIDLALEAKQVISAKTIMQLKEAFSDSILSYKVDLLDINNISDHFKTIVREQAVEFPTPQYKQYIPKLRFPEFKGEWEDKKLKHLCDVQTGNKDTQNRVEDGLYPFFVRSNTIEKINSFSFDGEAILTSGDGVGVGKNFHYINGKFDFHQRVYCLNSFKNNVVGKFIFYFFSTFFYKRVMKLNAKNSVDSVRRDMIVEMDCSLPSKPEQQKIANFLTAIDDLLVKLQEKKSLLTEYKTGAMQQIFEQKIRFTDDHGNPYPDWEEKKLGEVLEPIPSKRFQIQSTEIKEIGIYAVVDQGQNLIAGYSDRQDLLFTHVPVIVFGDHTTILKYIDFEFVVGADGTKLLKSKSNNLKYLYYNLIFHNVKQEGYKRHFTMLSEVYLQLPSLPEQQKIANFLTSIDAKIEAVAEQIGQAQAYKKALLQQMFV